MNCEVGKHELIEKLLEVLARNFVQNATANREALRENIVLLNSTLY